MASLMRVHCPRCGSAVGVTLRVVDSQPHAVTLGVTVVLNLDGSEHHCPMRDGLPAAA